MTAELTARQGVIDYAIRPGGLQTLEKHGAESWRDAWLGFDRASRCLHEEDDDPPGPAPPERSGSRFDPRVFLVPLQGGEPRSMPGFSVGEGWVNPMAFSPDGRLAVAAGNRPPLLRVWHLESGEVRVLDIGARGKGCTYGEGRQGRVWALKFLADGNLVTVATGAIHIWDLDAGTSRELRPCVGEEFESYLAADPSHKRFLVSDVNKTTRLSKLTSYDLETGIVTEIPSHGNRVYVVALDPTGTIIVTGDRDGVVRVGPISGESPHLLFGHELEISTVAVSPDGKWIASGSQDGTIRLWPMPEGTPFHTLPYDEILQRLRAFTNLRVVPDEAADTGYRVEVGPFPGWKTLPSW